MRSPSRSRGRAGCSSSTPTWGLARQARPAGVGRSPGSWTADAHVGVALFPGDASRVSAASAGASWLAKRPLLPNAEAIGAALREVAEARGEAVLFGYERSSTGPMLYGAVDVRDDERAKAGLAALVKALEAKEVSTALGARGLVLKAGPTVIERLGDVTRVRLSRDEETVSATLVRQTNGKLSFASGLDASSALRKVIAPEDGALGALPGVRALVDLTGPEVFGAALADVGALAPGPRGGDERRIWVAAAVRVTGGRVVLRAVAEPAALERVAPLVK